MYQFVSEKDSMFFLRSHIHQRCNPFIIIRRNQTIQVTQLYNRTYMLISLYRFFRKYLLLFCHTWWLHLHSQTSHHRYIKTKFQRHSSAGLMIRRSTDMRCHSNWREEIRSSPLHINTLQGIRIITDPKFIKSCQYTIISTPATTGTCLHYQVRILKANTFYNLPKTSVIVNV